MELRLTAEERAAILELEREGVLQEVRGNLFATPNGIIDITCGDCDQSDITKRIRSTIILSGEKDRVHELKLNGGGIRLAPGTPFSSPDLFGDLIESSRLKKISEVVLCGHVPCGKARAHALSMPSLVDHLIRAKMHVHASVAEQNTNMRFVCLLHIDHGQDYRRHDQPHRKQLRFISRGDWERVKTHFF